MQRTRRLFSFVLALFMVLTIMSSFTASAAQIFGISYTSSSTVTGLSNVPTLGSAAGGQLTKTFTGGYLQLSAASQGGCRSDRYVVSASKPANSDLVRVSYDWMVSAISGGAGNSIEVEIVDSNYNIFLATTYTNGATTQPRYYTGGATLTENHSAPAGTALGATATAGTWFTVTVDMDFIARTMDLTVKNRATGATHAAVSNIAMPAASGNYVANIVLQAVRYTANVTATMGINNVLVETQSSTPVTFRASANGNPTTTTTALTLNLDPPVTGLTSSNITLAPAGSATVGTPSTADGGATWTVPVSSVVAGDVTVGVQNVTGLAFEPSSAGADKVTLFAGATAKYSVAANGSATVTSDSIAITFDTPVSGLTAAAITLSPAGAAVKGVLTGSGTDWTLAISEARAGDVTVSIGNIPNFVIEPASPGVSDKTTLFKRAPDQVKFAAVADGNAAINVRSSKIDIAFDSAVTGLTAGAITLSPAGAAVKGALTGSGANWSLALSNITSTLEVTVSIADFGDYTFAPLAANSDKTTLVYVYVKPEVTFTGNEWTTNSSTNFVFQIGGENPRSNYYLYDTEAKAKDNFTLYPFADEAGLLSNSDNILPLNGTWKFKFALNPSQRVWPTAGVGQAPRDFNTLGFDAGDWDDITVPGSWQVNFNANGLAKYDQPQYTNSKNAWSVYVQNNSLYPSNNTTTAPAAPTVYNGVGTYQRHFTVPAGWTGKQVFLNFDGISGCYVWINGRNVGWTTDIWTHHEFDVTPYINAGDNVIALQLIRWTSGSWLENQDMLRLSGIARNTYLMARNAEDIWDFEVTTKPVSPTNLNTGLPTGWTLNLKAAIRDFTAPTRTSGESKPVCYKLYDAEGAVVAQGSSTADYAYVNMVTSSGVSGSSNTVTSTLPFGGGVRYTATPEITGSTNISLAIPQFTATLANPRLWSAEDPYLYKLVIYVDNGDQTEYTCARVGFRYNTYVNATNSQTLTNGVYVASAGSYWLVNGKRLTFYGANIHESNPDTGYAMTLDLIRKDETLMKLFNVNAIRMSHYPHDTRYYDIADELGIYVMDEVNHESHNSTGNSTNAIFFPTLRDRTLNMFERDKNMTCVVSWSAGNESAMSATSAPYSIYTLKARENEFNGLIGVNGGGGRPTHAQYAQTYADMWAGMYPSYSSINAADQGKIKINCEYSHAMGNSLGNMDTYVCIAEGSSYNAGGFIWDWVDQSIKTPVKPSTTVTGIRGDNSGEGTFFGYDGDWGNQNGDLDFGANGVILADRTPKPEAAEVKRLYQRLKVTANGAPTATSVGYTVKNSFMHTNANDFDMTWQLYENGAVIREGSGILDVAPEPYATANAKYTSGTFAQSFDAVTTKPGAEYFFNIQFRLRTATDWAQKGYIIAENQLPLTTGAFTPIAKPVVPMTVDQINVSGTSGGTAGTIEVTGPDGLFSYVFNKQSGTFSDLKFKGKQFATLGFEPNFYMPVTDNQAGEAVSGGSNGSMATEIIRWKNTGANRVQTSTTYSVANTYANYVEIVNTSANTSAAAQSVTMTTTYRIYPTGEINVGIRYVFGASSTAYINVVGGYLKLAPGMENVTYFARGPEENYVDRKTGTDVGVYSTTVSDNYVEYITSQDTGERHDTRWAAITDDTGFGVVMKAGQFAANDLFSGAASAYNPAEAAYNMSNLVEFNALHYSPTQFGDARLKHPYQVYDEFGRNDAKLPTYLYVNIASRGRGADTSWGTQATPKGVYRINYGGKTVNYNFSIKPVDAFSTDSAMTFSQTRRVAYQNVKDMMPVALDAGVPTAAPAYVSANALAASAAELAAVNVFNALYEAIESTKTLHIYMADGLATASITFDDVPPVSGKIYVAFYNADGKMIAVSENTQTISSGDFIRVSTGASVPPGAANVRAFYWDEGFIPICPQVQAVIG